MEKDRLKLFGLRLKELRKNKGVSQERLALEAGCARSYISGLELGKRNISYIMICKLADYLGVEPYQMMLPPANNEIPSKEN